MKRGLYKGSWQDLPEWRRTLQAVGRPEEVGRQRPDKEYRCGRFDIAGSRKTLRLWRRLLRDQARKSLRFALTRAAAERHGPY